MRNSVRSTLSPVRVALFMSALGACTPVPTPPPTGGSPPSLGISGDSLHTLATNMHRWVGPQIAERDCINAFRCGWPIFRKRTEVEVWAEENAKTVPPNPSRATLVGKFENRGGVTEAMYGLVPGPYDYLMWVLPGSGAHGRWTVVQVDRRTGHRVQVVSEGEFQGCNHPRQWEMSFARFRTCGDGPPDPPLTSRTMGRNPAGLQQAGFNLFSFLAFLQSGLDEDPSWYTCTSGCCVANAARLANLD